MVNKKDIEYLYKAADVARKALESNNHPFGCIVVDGGGKVIMESGNLCNTKNNYCAHAESEAAYYLASKYPIEYLQKCTLYSTFEPCCMCTGTIYWANIGRIVYALTERKLLSMTKDNIENQTFNISCREILAKGQKQIIIDGPIDDKDLEKRILEDHKEFWN